MFIDYDGVLIDSKINEFYSSNDANILKYLVDYVKFSDVNSTEAFLFLLNETKTMPPLKIGRKPRAQHAIWVAKCVSFFLEKNKVYDVSYLYSALWHDLIEDSIKNKNKKANAQLINDEANILVNRINGKINQELINKTFNVVKKLTKEDTKSYIEYVDQMYSGELNTILMTSFIKNCDMIVNCDTSHVFNSMKQIRQFLKYFKKLNIDRCNLVDGDLNDSRWKLIYDSNLELSRLLREKIEEELHRYEKENNVSEEGRELWRQLAKIYGDKYDGYNRITSPVNKKEIILNPASIFDGTISSFKAFLEPYESIEFRKEKELKFHNDGKDYLALIGLWNLAGKFYEDPKFYVKGF